MRGQNLGTVRDSDRTPATLTFHEELFDNAN